MSKALSLTYALFLTACSSYHQDESFSILNIELKEETLFFSSAINSQRIWPRSNDLWKNTSLQAHYFSLNHTNIMFINHNKTLPIDFLKFVAIYKPSDLIFIQTCYSASSLYQLKEWSHSFAIFCLEGSNSLATSIFDKTISLKLNSNSDVIKVLGLIDKPYLSLPIKKAL